MRPRSNGNVVYACRYHVVGCPKYRRKVLVEPVATRLAGLIGEVVAARGGAPLSAIQKYIQQRPYGQPRV